MASRGVDALMVTDSDPHLSEYLSPQWKERSWLSGFTGSNGIFVVTQEKTALLTDSRYELQSKYQLGDKGTDIITTNKMSDLCEWLRLNLAPDAKVSFRGDCFSIKIIESIQKCLTSMKFCSMDLVSPLWHDRPQEQCKPIFVLREEFSGESMLKKISRVRTQMSQRNVQALLLTALDEIAWLFNVRGADAKNVPFVDAFALVLSDECYFFCDKRKIDDDVNSYFFENKIQIRDINELSDVLKQKQDVSMWADVSKLNFELYQQVRSVLKCTCPTPVCYFKSIKNETEISGIEKACVYDGVALVRFNIWLENALALGEKITEISVARKLYEFRSVQPDFWGESFDSIVAYADHGAVVHYSATTDKDVEILPKNFLLIDSGGQYFCGTTDITRNFVLGEISEQQRRDYTLVLKGNIALASAIFPEGTTGAHLDVLARQFLWKNNLNYGHGTGHGIGHFLSVHEGPQAIRCDQNAVALKPGMLTSDEPGIYREGEYGIRLENMILTENYTKSDFGSFFHFRTLTLFPFEKQAIDFSLLSDDEKLWLKNYNAEIWTKLSPSLSEEEKQWLKEKINY